MKFQKVIKIVNLELLFKLQRKEDGQRENFYSVKVALESALAKSPHVFEHENVRATFRYLYLRL